MNGASMNRFLVLSCLTLLLAACAPQGPSALIVVTHDSFAASDSVIKSFEQAQNAKVTFIKSGDAGAALSKVILSKAAPLGDVFYGVDNTFLSTALAAWHF